MNKRIGELKRLKQESEFFQQELEKARERVGTNQDKAKEWLQAFMEADLNRYSEGDWNNKLAEIEWFARNGPAPAKTENIPFRTHKNWSPERKGQGKAILRPSREQAAQLQNSLKSWVRALLDKHQIEIGPYPLTLRVYHPRFPMLLYPNADMPRNGFCDLYMSNLEQTFSFHALMLLSNYAGLIRRCPEKDCGKIFIADRRNKVFCDRNCLSRAAMRKYRQEHGLVTGQPRGRPRKEPIKAAKAVSAKKPRRRKSS